MRSHPRGEGNSRKRMNSKRYAHHMKISSTKPVNDHHVIAGAS